MRKRIIILIAVLCLFTVSGTALAAQSFDFTFKPPYAGSMKSTVLVRKKAGTSPYVWPHISATPTNYFLSPKQKSATQATNIIQNVSSPGKRYFTYLPDYGGADSLLCLSGYPTYYEFTTYRVYGEWSP